MQGDVIALGMLISVDINVGDDPRFVVLVG